MKTKMVAIFATLMIALMAVGVAYAHWSQILYIEGTVNTGKLWVGLRDTGVNDKGLDPGFDTDLDVQVLYDKDVGSITSTNVDEKFVKDGHTYYHKEVITIDSAYPSYAPGWWTEVTNGGTIPVKIESFVVTPDPAAWPKWIELLKWKKWILDPSGVCVLEANGASHPIPGYIMYGELCFDALLTALIGQQLEPCDTFKLYIELHTTQEFVEMPMGATFTFDVTATFTQWNMVP